MITRRDAKEQGRKLYFTGTPCKHGHISSRRTVNGTCCECFRIAKRASYANTRDQHLLYMKDYHTKNKASSLAYGKSYYLLHQTKFQQYSRDWYQQKIKDCPEYNSQNYDKNKEWHERHNEQYYRTHMDYYINYWDVNSARYNHHTAKRRAAIKQAIPPWADMDLIHAMYQECKLITEITGIPHEVDHVVPLQSDLVCGLHWVGNLQIISQTANRKKSNKV